MSSDIAVKVEQLGKTFKTRRGLKRFFQAARGMVSADRIALRDVNFEIRKGESFGVVGVNGSGKSTLLQIIAGTMAPTHGSAHVSGSIAAILELGAGFHPEFTGRENATLGLTLNGFSQSGTNEEVERIKEFSELGDAFDMPVKNYSSGMYVRLAFSVAISGRPDILIVDEALAVGDAAFQRKCYDKLAELKAGGGTLIFVSHDEEAVRTLTDRAVLLHKGEQVKVAKSDEIAFLHRRIMMEPKASPKTFGTGKSYCDDSVSDFGIVVLNESGEQTTVFKGGDRIRLGVSFTPKMDFKGLNVNIRLRSSTGTKVFSSGTLNEDMKLESPETGFWGRNFIPGQSVSVEFDFECRLGEGQYEVQIMLTHEGTPDYLNQKILAWMDEAVNLVILKDNASIFGGMFDLRPKIITKQVACNA